MNIEARALPVEPQRQAIGSAADGGTILRAPSTVALPGAFLPEAPVQDAAFQQAGVGMAVVDADGRFVRVNDELCRLTGKPADAMVGRSLFDETYALDIEPDLTQFRRQVSGTLDRYAVEKRIKRGDGSHFQASVTSTAVRDAAGRFLYAVRVQHDMSRWRAAEDALGQRVEELAALYGFTERLQHAGALEEVCRSGLDAVQRALRCSRASILLKDAAGVMRFAAWHGLSEGYRRAVEGHSPWAPDAIRPDPICIPDVAASDLPPPIRAAVDAEAIRAVAFIPLVENGRVIGKFMAYYDAPHAFTPNEIDVAQILGRQLAFGVERARAEETRRGSERAAQHLAAIVESSDDAIISKDLDGVIMTWNRGAERLFGYTADEVIGQPVTMLIPPERLEEEPGILARIRGGQRIEHYETLRRRKDGRLIDISLTISPIRDSAGRIVGASKIARDITARKLADQRVRDSEQRLQDLLAAIPAAIYTTDAAGKITYFNEQAVALAGRTPTIGSDEWCVTWKLFQPDGTPLPHDQCPMAIALKEGRPIRDAEAVAERPDGSRVPFIPYPTPLRDGSGKVVGAINMLVDISERKQAETQQRLLLSELNHRVKNNMQMLQSLLVTAARETGSAEARQILAEAGNRLAAMSAAQRVLYVTTNATGFGAGEFLNAVCQSVQHALPKSIRLDWRADEVELSNDVAMPLALIVNELATNAVKHGLKDCAGGVVRIGLTRVGPETVDGDAAQSSGGPQALLLYVEDDGPGFDLDQARSRSSGLRLVQGLARQLRGRFEVTRGAATRCSLYFS